jgi:arylsulfatase
MTAHRSRRERRLIPALAACLALLACGAPDRPSGPPNILLVTLDTTRADHLGAWGYFRDTSPRIDELARESILFERALAPVATTLPTHLSILTATQPAEHGVLANLDHGGRRFVPSASLVSFAQVCRDAGYRTAAFVSSVALRTASGVEAGFETFDAPTGDSRDRRGDVTTRVALAWLDAQDRGPWLLWVHYYDAHWPFRSTRRQREAFQTDEALERYLVERRVSDRTVRPGVGTEDARDALNAYDAALLFQDEQVGRLLDAVHDRGGAPPAILLVGDHGEGLAQHGFPAHGGTWDEHLHVPLLIRAPGVAPRRVSHPVSLVDSIPTLLALIDAPALGRFLAQASGRDALAPREVPGVVSRDTGRQRSGRGYRWALTTPRWKYFRVEEASGETRDELYDLESDPFELDDVAGAHAHVVAELSAALDERLAGQRAHALRIRPEGELETAPADPQLQQQLRALGYVD